MHLCKYFRYEYTLSEPADVKDQESASLLSDTERLTDDM